MAKEVIFMSDAVHYNSGTNLRSRELSFFFGWVVQGNRCVLFVNVCKWSRLPRPETDDDPVPVKGGTLRHVVKKGKRTPSLLFDLAFNPYVTDECGAEPLLHEMLVSLTMQFIADTTGIEVDPSKSEKLTRSHKGPLKDIYHSLDESFNHLLPEECRLDVRDTILDALHCRNSQKDSSRGTVLPPLRLPGDLQSIPKQPLIQELPEMVGKSRREAPHKRVQFPEHTMDVSDGIVTVCVNLPGVNSVADVDLEISEVGRVHHELFH